MSHHGDVSPCPIAALGTPNPPCRTRISVLVLLRGWGHGSILQRTRAISSCPTVGTSLLVPWWLWGRPTPPMQDVGTSVLVPHVAVSDPPHPTPQPSPAPAGSTPTARSSACSTCSRRDSSSHRHTSRHQLRTTRRPSPTSPTSPTTTSPAGVVGGVGGVGGAPLPRATSRTEVHMERCRSHAVPWGQQCHPSPQHTACVGTAR